MNTIYTLGYSGWSLEAIEAKVRELGAVLVDIRMVPRSRKPGFSSGELRERLGQPYPWAKPGGYTWEGRLGNANYRGGPIQLANPEDAAERLRITLSQRPVILMCGCRHVEQCHRKVAAEFLSERLGANVVHLEPPSTIGGGIRGLSLWQPWASLIAGEFKTIETRSWSTPYRGPLAIHAAKKWNSELAWLCQEEPFAECLEAMGVDLARLKETLPFGAVVAVAELVHVAPTEQEAPRIARDERDFGDYSPGRFAWVLDNIRAVEPIPCRGAQGFFSLPPEVLSQLSAQLNERG